jgi:hypothetical protein
MQCVQCATDHDVVRADVDLPLLAPVGGHVDGHASLGPLQLVRQTQGHDLANVLLYSLSLPVYYFKSELDCENIPVACVALSLAKLSLTGLTAVLQQLVLTDLKS